MAVRILFVIGNLDVGGAERHLVQVLPRLSRLGLHLAIYTITHKGKLATVLEDAGIEVIEPFLASALRKLPSWVRKPILLLSSVPSFCILLLKLRPKVVHFYLPEAYLLGGLCSLAFGNRIRIMSRRSLNRYQLKYPFFARIERWLHPHMNAVLGNSKAVVRELREEGVKEDRLGLLYNGTDLAPFNDLPSRSSVRQNLGINERVLLMVCVANLIPYKGHADLIHALGGIRAELPDDWAIAMVGLDSGLGVELRVMAERQGVVKHILWLGERSDVISIYAAAEIGVLCSHQEGFSNSVLEGMAAGAAMVVTDVGGNAEAVLDGECGLVVPAHDPSALGKAILTLVRDGDIRRRMARAGQLRVAEKFSLNGCVIQYAGLYRALLSDPGCAVQEAIDAAGDGNEVSANE